MSKALIVLLLLCGSAVAQHTYYISQSVAGASDSNTSTQAQSKSTPWKDLPGSRTSSPTYTPVAGDTFILMGCDDWPNATFPINWTWSGTSGSPITIDRDVTWFNATNCPSGWNRAKFDAGSAVINPPECTGTDAFWVFGNVSNVTVNWIELVNYFWASPVSDGSCAGHDFWVTVNSSASNVKWVNTYVHAWTHDAASHDLNGNAFSNGCPTCVVDYAVIDNTDGSHYSGGGQQWPTTHSIFVYVTNAIKPHMGGEYAYNNISHLGTGPGGNHPNCIETIGPIPSNASTFWIHDNWIHDMPLPEQCETLQVGNTGETDYVFNNVWCCNIGGGDIAQLPQNSQPNVTAFYYFNNIWEENNGNGVCANVQGPGTEWLTAFVMVNNFCLVPNTPNGTTQSQKMMSGNAVTGATTITFSNNIVETMAAASGHGCSNSVVPPYVPGVSTCRDTVGTGTNLTSTLWPGGFSTNDTTFACTEQTISGVVQSVCPQRVSNARPSSGAWDSGAYEFANPQVTYSVTMAGNHTGDTVTSSPAGINCPTTCSASFTSGTSVTLTENPISPYFAYGFSSPCPTVTNFGAPCTLVISSATSVTANFNHVTLPQLWTNNMEYLFATSNVVNFPTFWLCNSGTRYPASGNYANTAAGLTQVGNDAEQCRHDTNTGTTIIVPAGQTYSSANGLQITQLAGDNSTQFIVFTSSNPAPLGTTLCSHGIQKNLPGLTRPGLWNPGCNGLNMYYQLGTQIFTIPVGPFTLNNNTATNTSQYNDIAHLFTLEATGANQNAFSTCVTFTGGNCTADWDSNNVGVHNIALLNSELRPVAGQASAGAPYKVGLSTETLVSQIPNHIHLAYSYVHGDWQEAPMSGCPSACVATGIPAGTNSLPYAMFIAGCLFCSEMYNYVDGNLRPGAEGHGIGLLLAQENKRHHNWIAGGSIGSICGGWGASMPISNFVTCLNDDDYSNNYTYPYSWMLAFNGGFNPSGGSFVRKNAHEYKFAQFALFGGSICENVDNSGAQNGTACSWKTAQNSGGGAGLNYWTTLNNVTVENIIMDTACNGPSFGDRSAAVGNGGGVSLPTQMISFNNILAYNISINLPGCSVSGFSSAPQYSIRNGQSVPSATWSATATRDALGQTTTFTLTAGSGNGVTDFSLGDPLTSTGCSDATFNVGNTVMGPPVLSGSTLGTTAPPLTLIVNNPGTANATATGCTVSNAQGYPNYIFLNHATIIADAGSKGPYDSALSGTNIHALARNISYQNSIFVNGGLSSSSGEGTAVSTRDYDPTTFTFNNSFIGGRTAANYTEYPSLASPPTTLYLTPTNNCTGNDPTTGTCLGILAGMSTSTFPLVPGAVGPYIAGDYHAFRLCQATDVACNSKQSLYGAGNTNQATDGTDLGVNFATLDAAQNSTLYACTTPCGLGPFIDTIAIVPAPCVACFIAGNWQPPKVESVFKGVTK